LEVKLSEKSPTKGTSIRDLITTNPFLYKLAFSSLKTYFKFNGLIILLTGLEFVNTSSLLLRFLLTEVTLLIKAVSIVTDTINEKIDFKTNFIFYIKIQIKYDFKLKNKTKKKKDILKN
jgi:hypothetical protein